MLITIDDKQKEIVRSLSAYSDWSARYNFIIQKGKNLTLMAPEHKTPDNLIKGCQSRVWLYAGSKENHIFFDADSDTIITKGLIALMIYIYSSHTPQEILASPLFFLDETGLSRHLSNRSTGLAAMINQIRNSAANFDKLPAFRD